MKNILGMFKDSDGDFSSMRLKSFFSFLQFVTLVVLIIVNAKYIPGYPVLVAWVTAAFAPKTIQSFIEQAYGIKGTESEDMSIGFFTDDLGKLSITRVMGFISLIISIVYTDVLVITARAVDVNILLLLLTCAFAPGLIQKIAEKNLKFNRDDFEKTSKELTNILDSYIAKALPAMVDKIISGNVDKAVDEIGKSIGNLPTIPKVINTPRAIKEVPVNTLFKGTPTSIGGDNTVIDPKDVAALNSIIGIDVSKVIPADLPWSVGTQPGNVSHLDEDGSLLDNIK